MILVQKSDPVCKSVGSVGLSAAKKAKRRPILPSFVVSTILDGKWLMALSYSFFTFTLSCYYLCCNIYSFESILRKMNKYMHWNKIKYNYAKLQDTLFALHDRQYLRWNKIKINFILPLKSVLWASLGNLRTKIDTEKKNRDVLWASVECAKHIFAYLSHRKLSLHQINLNVTHRQPNEIQNAGSQCQVQFHLLSKKKSKPTCPLG